MEEPEWGGEAGGSGEWGSGAGMTKDWGEEVVGGIGNGRRKRKGRPVPATGGVAAGNGEVASEDDKSGRPRADDGK
jgi:hypothetical protein